MFIMLSPEREKERISVKEMIVGYFLATVNCQIDDDPT